MSDNVVISSEHVVEVEALDTSSANRSEQPAIRTTALDSVNITMSVEIGRLTMPLKNVRALKQGEVVPLDRGVGEPMDIRVNGRLVARGEVVATDSRKYGIRLTEIAAPDAHESSA